MKKTRQTNKISHILSIDVPLITMCTKRLRQFHLSNDQNDDQNLFLVFLSPEPVNHPTTPQVYVLTLGRGSDLKI